MPKIDRTPNPRPVPVHGFSQDVVEILQRVRPESLLVLCKPGMGAINELAAPQPPLKRHGHQHLQPQTKEAREALVEQGSKG